MARFSIPAFLTEPAPPDHIAIGSQRYALLVKRHPRARRIKLRADPVRTTLILTMPPQARLAEAMQFVRSQQEWIVSAFAEGDGRMRLIPGVTVPFRGKDHRIVWEARLGRTVRAEQGILQVGGPQDLVETRLLRWLQAQARQAFADDLAEFCARANEAPVRLGISNAARRWGSCSTRRSIRLNWRLIAAPEWVRRSVVAHEVAHLRHMDHSPHFYAWLDQIDDGQRHAADRWLKKHGTVLQRIGAP